MSELGLGYPDHDTVEPAPPTGGRRRNRGHGALATIIAIAVVVAAIGAVAYFGRTALSGLLPGGTEDFPGPGTGSVDVRVASGDTVSAIGTRLEDAGVVASREAFVEAANEDSRATGIQPGTYELRAEMAAVDALAILVNPDNRIVDSVALPEGLLLDETLTRIADGTGASLGDLQAAVADPAALGLPAYAQGHVEGFLFPATYEFEPATEPAALLGATVTRFNQAATTVGLEAGAQQVGRTPLEVVTIASIIQAEAGRSEDMPKVARVIYNRLAQGMALQMDSTVHYFAGKDGSVFTTDEDRATDNPYNTYKYVGLPPGPINSPGEEALAAALNPAEGSWLYFVTVNLETSETLYGTTLEEHEANVARLQEYCTTSDLC